MNGFQRAAAALLVAVVFAGPARAGADPKDGESIDSIMNAVYDVISGPAGEARDWDRFRALFIDGARLIPRAPKNPAGAVVLTPEDYITRSGPVLERDGFFEQEIGRKVDQYGDIAQVFSAYAAKRNADDAEPFMRGINSFQLMKHEGRWRVVTIFWQAETPDNPVPEEYLAE
ncbi:MAG: hypothetical protein VX640_14865 [Pseudomonadota bacterium]|nr:hypothetical protein [Pseudomonadota bacterium]